MALANTFLRGYESNDLTETSSETRNLRNEA
jgi:hypothetical protein